jgi:hypothetical protein
MLHITSVGASKQELRAAAQHIVFICVFAGGCVGEEERICVRGVVGGFVGVDLLGDFIRTDLLRSSDCRRRLTQMHTILGVEMLRDLRALPHWWTSFAQIAPSRRSSLGGNSLWPT